MIFPGFATVWFAAWCAACATSPRPPTIRATTPNASAAEPLETASKSEIRTLVDEWQGMKLWCVADRVATNQSNYAYEVERASRDGESRRPRVRLSHRLLRAKLALDGAFAGCYCDSVDQRQAWMPTADVNGSYAGIVFVDSRGVVVQDISVRRLSRRVSESEPYPTFSDVLRLNHGESILVRMDEGLIDSGGESWWVFEAVHGGLFDVYSPWMCLPPEFSNRFRFLEVVPVNDGSALAAVMSLRSLPLLRSQAGQRETLEFGDTLCVFDVQKWPKLVWRSPDSGDSTAAAYRIANVGPDGVADLESYDGRRSHLSVNRVDDACQVRISD